MNIQRLKIFIFLFPITLFFVFILMKIFWNDVYTLIIQEDAVLENIQAVLYFTSSIIAFILSTKFLRNKMTVNGVLYRILAIGLLFVFIEEISWGQRIFNLVNPIYFEQHNVQKEISLHNLDAVQSKLHKMYIFVGAGGSFSWIFTALFLSKMKATYRRIIIFAVPSWFISSYFFFVFFIYTLYDYMIHPYPGGFFVWRDQEACELLLSLGFFSFVVTNYLELHFYLSMNRVAHRPLKINST